MRGGVSRNLQANRENQEKQHWMHILIPNETIKLAFMSVVESHSARREHTHPEKPDP